MGGVFLVDIANWFLSFVAQAVTVIFGIQSSDGYSLGSMAVGIAIISAVVSGTIGAVAIFGRNHTISVSDRSYRKGDE